MYSPSITGMLPWALPQEEVPWASNCECGSVNAPSVSATLPWTLPEEILCCLECRRWCRRGEMNAPSVTAILPWTGARGRKLLFWLVIAVEDCSLDCDCGSVNVPSMNAMLPRTGIRLRKLLSPLLWFAITDADRRGRMR